LIEQMLMLSHPNDVFTLEYCDLGRVVVTRGPLGFLGISEASTEAALARTAGRAAKQDLKFGRGPRAASRIANYNEIRKEPSHTR
jgi:hypothetical protein